jgi:hypothetical protein
VSHVRCWYNSDHCTVRLACSLSTRRGHAEAVARLLPKSRQARARAAIRRATNFNPLPHPACSGLMLPAQRTDVPSLSPHFAEGSSIGRIQHIWHDDWPPPRRTPQTIRCGAPSYTSALRSGYLSKCHTIAFGHWRKSLGAPPAQSTSFPIT